MRVIGSSCNADVTPETRGSQDGATRFTAENSYSSAFAHRSESARTGVTTNASRRGPHSMRLTFHEPGIHTCWHPGPPMKLARIADEISSVGDARRSTDLLPVSAPEVHVCGCVGRSSGGQCDNPGRLLHGVGGVREHRQVGLESWIVRHPHARRFVDADAGCQDYV